ncbi:MAG: hypothetical protein KGL38_09275, partial [Gemmatimonadota bacterium]|nr:hypothetical protein [Gemmatimonadota bacterium]
MLLALVAGVAFTRPARLTALVLTHRSEPAFEAAAELPGSSRAVELTVALPGDSVHLPVDLSGDSVGLRYEWVAVGDTVRPAYAQGYDARSLYAPAKPGFYRLALLRDTTSTVLDAPTLAVLMPFPEKRGGEIG